MPPPPASADTRQVSVRNAEADGLTPCWRRSRRGSAARRRRAPRQRSSPPTKTRLTSFAVAGCRSASASRAGPGSRSGRATRSYRAGLRAVRSAARAGWSINPMTRTGSRRGRTARSGAGALTAPRELLAIPAAANSRPSNRFIGVRGDLPITWLTAIASPIARPNPSTQAAITPDASSAARRPGSSPSASRRAPRRRRAVRPGPSGTGRASAPR